MLSFAFGVKAIISGAEAGFTKDTIIEILESALTAGLGVLGLTIALGAQIGVALAAGAVAFTVMGVALVAMIGLNMLLQSNEDKIEWGNYEATQEENVKTDMK